ncbi:pilus assembly protein CpaB [Propionispira arboris]|uniref:Pilus assembly protein CpaB n=1 Tax=Propionispira arboris TaxID=84035 RepID=A0A1H7BS05_9FIRM|nr:MULTISPECIES: Flp pilus assembly protein CpaB [Propionispira]SEJ79814.1 pilus assembly protein CpaB [Propionispira arboris]
MHLPEIPKRLLEKLEMMAPKQLIILAFCASFIVGLLIYTYLSGLETKQDTATESFTDVIVAAVDIPERTVIREEMLKTVHMPNELVQTDAIKDMSAAAGKVAKLKILQGDSITANKLFGDVTKEGFIASIPADKRAISIAITDITGISGFAKPGEYVDVMVIDDKKQKNTVSGEMILQNILLLAINKDSDTVDSKKDDKKDQMATATMAVSPEDAIRLAVAQTKGTIYLVLRPFKPKDSFILTTEVVTHQFDEGTTAPLMNQNAATNTSPPFDSRTARENTPAAVPMQGAPVQQVPREQPIVDSVTVIRGNTMSSVAVR